MHQFTTINKYYIYYEISYKLLFHTIYMYSVHFIFRTVFLLKILIVNFCPVNFPKLENINCVFICDCVPVRPKRGLDKRTHLKMIGTMFGSALFRQFGNCEGLFNIAG